MKIKSKVGLFAAILFLFASSGCRTALFQPLHSPEDPELLTEIRENPNRHKGKLVLLGGTVRRLRYQEWKTELELSEIPLENGVHPSLGHPPGERFYVIFPERLDRFMYMKGKVMTISARVIGTRSVDGDQFPLLAYEKVHVWNKLRQDRFPSFGALLGRP
ncbi:MAG: Slp family lipoprotein [Nitrospiria bacterium]